MALVKNKLRTHQEAAVDYVKRNLPQKKSILVVAPTATGKTDILAELVRYYASRGKRVLVLGHRREINKQLWVTAEARGSRAGLVQAGEDDKEDWKARVQVASIQTLTARKLRVPADVIFIDEAHHAVAKTYRKLLFSQKHALRVGFTATPVVGSKRSGIRLSKIFSALFEALTIRESVRRGIIAPVDGHVWVADWDKAIGAVRPVNGDFPADRIGEVMSRRHIVGSIIDHWKKDAKGVPTLLFAASRAQAKLMAEEFSKAGVSADYTHGALHKTTRKAKLLNFEAGRTKVLCNVDLYTEGVDLPFVKCIILARPTYSVVKYLQMVGRGRRGADPCLVQDHGGLIAEHGFPDDPRDWTLGGVSKEKLVRCPACERVRSADVLRCDNADCPSKQDLGDNVIRLRTNDVPWIRRGYKHTFEEFAARREKARKLIREGAPIRVISRKLGIKVPTLNAWRRAMGIRVERGPVRARYGRLVPTGKERPPARSGVTRTIECRCDCGRVVWRKIGQLNSGLVKSCGCLGPEARRLACQKPVVDSNGRLFESVKKAQEHYKITPMQARWALKTGRPVKKRGGISFKYAPSSPKPTPRGRAPRRR